MISTNPFNFPLQIRFYPRIEFGAVISQTRSGLSEKSTSLPITRSASGPSYKSNSNVVKRGGEKRAKTRPKNRKKDYARVDG